MHLNQSLGTPLLSLTQEKKLALQIFRYRLAFQRMILQEPAVVHSLIDLLDQWQNRELRIDGVCSLAMNDCRLRKQLEPKIRINIVTLKKLVERLAGLQNLDCHTTAAERRQSHTAIVVLIEELSIRQRHFEAAPFSNPRAQMLLDHYFQLVQQMTLANMRMVIPIAKKFCGNSPLLADMIQEGNRGLMRAVTKFDYRRNLKFSTYATSWIKQAILAALPNVNRTIRLPDHYRALGRQVQRLSQSESVGPIDNGFNVSRIACRLKLAPTEAARLICAQQDTYSLDQPMDGLSEQVMLRNMVTDPGNTNPLQLAAAKEENDWVHQLLESLDPREQAVIRLRFGIEDGVDRTLAEVGSVLGITRERARQIEKLALSKLGQRSPQYA